MKDGRDWLALQPQLQGWFESPVGESLLRATQQKLDILLPRVFGYQGLQVGQLSDQVSFLEHAGLSRRFVVDAPQGDMARDVSANASQLPFASDTMNLILLAHTLDFCHSPHQILREADRVLTRDGHLAIVGFNPVGWWGLKKLTHQWRDVVPWNGHFHRRSRVCDWLSLLGYKLLHQEVVNGPAAFSERRISRQIAGITSRYFPSLGPVYVILARKQSIPMSLNRASWRPRRTQVIHAVFAGTERGVTRIEQSR